MRIALVATLVSPLREPQEGGTQAMVVDLASGLARRGHEVDVFAARGSRLESAAGLRVIDTGVDPAEMSDAVFRPRRGSRSTTAANDAFARVYQLVAAGGYDLVHNHGFDVAAIEAAERLAPPRVHTLHLPADRAMGAALGRVDATRTAIVAVSGSHARDWRRVARIDAVVRNGVDIGAIQWSPQPGTGALFAGRLSPEKGALEAIEICALAGVALTLTGSPYDPAYAESVRRRCQGEANLTLLEGVPRRVLWGMMAGSAVVICPAMWEEPFGLVAAEAQATGTPVVAFRRGALPDVIDDRVTGMLVPSGDIAAAAAAIPSAAVLSREAVRRHAEQALGFEKTLDGYEEVYARLVG